jgi:hypothetical protein
MKLEVDGYKPFVTMHGIMSKEITIMVIIIITTIIKRKKGDYPIRRLQDLNLCGQSPCDF